MLELNAEDGAGQAPRRFILCSSTEATAKEPAKDLCRTINVRLPAELYQQLEALALYERNWPSWIRTP